jgi:hypothetical protein
MGEAPRSGGRATPLAQATGRGITVARRRSSGLWFATLHEQIEAIRHFFRYLAGVKDQVRRLGGLKMPESFVA